MILHHELKTIIVLLVSSFLCSGKVVSQEGAGFKASSALCPTDTLSSGYRYLGSRDAWKKEFSYVGIPLFATGLLIWQQQRDYRAMRNSFVPKFNSLLDDYSQYSPLAATALLKAFGVKTRSSWARLSTSSAFSAAIMAAMVNSIKYTVKEMRPDNSTRNSFPSGHTATTFMCATIMHKELGAKSPWYSIGAYTVAATTGLFRILNNRHWINDVVFGAGIGITSVDLGYFIGDVLFKDKGVNGRYINTGTPDISGNPSFVSIGMSVGTSHDLSCPAIYDDYDETDGAQPLPPALNATPLDLKLKMGTTTSVSVEGAYFFNRYFGLGGRLRATACPITAEYNKNFQPYIFDYDGVKARLYQLMGIESASLGILGIDAGPYISFPLGKRWRIGGKLMIGDRLTTDFDLNSYSNLKPEFLAPIQEALKKGEIDQELYDELTLGVKDTEFLHIDHSHAINIGTGLSVTYAFKRNSSIRAYVDYTHSAPNYTYHLFNRIRLVPSSAEGDDDAFYIEDVFSKRTRMNELNFGISVAAIF
ncbi:phosphatase PAP2 family protein [Bacteroides helcogenes]|uniref:Phosphoesterase PA-phosphatase related protein n=1 Tax=Bacteroides helcogenes (strain ATCC 35417 / DSM 20613 / JCM 6297 / CCUG 15421 / P 36-108) TaxID=693979 RepID=E6SQ52_BACT6|nr:phosphatase PAP2 family protein [Bacteroides helcogenes]ADV43911.1 phosphoesterase PA-phosphatase related protein [Bacteroides helcogenes P 36-108]MDY5237537.1 phosphatase PAP2 family protein [Bacteroides helcogenes]